MQIRNRIAMVVLVMLVSMVVGAYANGQADTALEKKESVTLTGKIVITNRILPELTANGKTYYLLVPHIFSADSNVKDGDEVTITGNVVSVKNPANIPPFARIGNLENLVSIDKATINGKEFDLGNYAFKDGMHRGIKGGGMGRGMMWGYDSGSASK
jgi:hypothetical protein